MSVCVVGLDGVSLALATHYALRGLATVACDLDATLIARLAGGDLPWSDPELAFGFEHATRDGALRLRDSVEDAARDQQVVVIFTGLDVQHATVDYGRLDETVRRVGRGLREGTLVLVESTVGIGDTRDRIGRILAEESGLTIGVGFFLAHSPQQCAAGHVRSDLSRVPRVFGAADHESFAKATEFYSLVADSKLGPVRNCETAEFVKLLQLATRGSSTAVASQWSTLCAGFDIDLREAITVAASQSWTPIVEPRVDVPPDVHLALLLLSKFEDLRLVQSTRQALDTVFSRALARLGSRIGGLAGANILVLLPEAAAIPDHVSIALLATGARVSTHRAPPVDAIVYLHGAPALESLPEAVGDSCRALLDATGTLTQVHVERHGMQLVSAYLS